MLRRSGRTRHRNCITHCRIGDRADVLLMSRFRRAGFSKRRSETNSPRSLSNDAIHHLALCRGKGATTIRGRAWIAVGCGFRHTSTLELEWEFKPESAAFAILRVDTQTTFVELDDLSYECQAQPGSFSSLTSTNFSLYVWREQSSPAWSTFSNRLISNEHTLPYPLVSIRHQCPEPQF
jgi:hypothetical protein